MEHPQCPQYPHYYKTTYFQRFREKYLFSFGLLCAILTLAFKLKCEIGDYMSQLNIYKEHTQEGTFISNYFIDDYMKDANDAQLKVYLYLVRLLSGHMATSISDIADKFNHTEKDVLKALKYWEKQKLLSLDYNETKVLMGIRLLDIKEPVSEVSVSSEPRREAPVPAVPTLSMPSKQEEAIPKTIYSKTPYTMDQIKEFRKNAKAQEILFIAEQYIGKPLTPGEVQTIYFFYDELKFSVDLIDYLIQYCVGKGKREFRYIEKVAITWAEANVTTPKQAAGASSKYDKTVYTIMKALGKSNFPTTKEVSYISKWVSTYGFDMEVILEACDRTVMATDNHRFEYADSILSNWNQKNVHHLGDIKAVDKSYQAGKTSAIKTKSNTNKFNQFTQNSYDFDQLEKEILSN